MYQVLMANLPDELASWLGHRLGDISVHATHSAKETLENLARAKWSLLVINHALSGSTAPDVLSQVRNGLGLAKLPVVYCMGKGIDSELAGRLVGQFGVNQLLFHPIDREELARQVAATLGLSLPASRDGESQKQQHTLAAVATVWSRYKDTILGRVAVLDEAAIALSAGSLDGELRRKAAAEAHKLAGSVGTFGFNWGTRLAREAEHLLQNGAPLGQTQAPRLSELATSLRLELEQTPIAPIVQEAPDRSKPLLLVVDRDTDVAERLALEAEKLGMRARMAANLEAARGAVAQERPQVVLLDPSFAAGDGLTLLAELSACTPPVPVLVFTDRDALTDRVEVARLGGRGFLQKPMPPAKVLDAVSQLLSRLRAAEAKVLAVDDDPQVLASLKTILEARKLSVTTLADPLRFWEALEETPPDVLVLDVDMPHISGIELCRVVRNDPRWVGLPVVFLTAHTDPDTVRRVYAAGADDFLGKPIVGPEVVGRIVSCMERVKLLRSLAETDGLTHVATRRKSVEVLSQYLRLADRHSQPLSLAILNLDHFRSVNARYGRAAGDRVLRRLGVFLLQAFRSEDVVARWAGEEFIVGMYGMTREDGAHRLAEVLETLRLEEFVGPESARFRVSFSAGVAQYPEDGAGLEALYQRAEQALYQAKSSGRDRVLPAGHYKDQDQVDRKTDVVLVTADETMADVLIRALETRGYRSAWLQDGQAAVAALGGSDPCINARLVFLDADLPGLDGLSVLKQLAGNGLDGRVKTILLTDKPDENEDIRASALDRVAKPFNLMLLMQRVRRAIED